MPLVRTRQLSLALVLIPVLATSAHAGARGDFREILGSSVRAKRAFQKGLQAKGNTGRVALSTIMIGLGVGGAIATNFDWGALTGTGPVIVGILGLQQAAYDKKVVRGRVVSQALAGKFGKHAQMIAKNNLASITEAKLIVR